MKTAKKKTTKRMLQKAGKEWTKADMPEHFVEAAKVAASTWKDGMTADDYLETLVRVFNRHDAEDAKRKGKKAKAG